MTTRGSRAQEAAASTKDVASRMLQEDGGLLVGLFGPRKIGSFAFLVLSTVGYGLQIALVSLVGWPGSSAAFLPEASCPDAASAFALAKNLAYCLAFFAWSLLSLRGGRYYEAVFGKAPIYAVFSLLIVVAAASSSLPEGILCQRAALRGALLGIGVSGNFALWQRALCSRETPLDARALIGGTVAGGLLYFLIASLPAWMVPLATAFVIAPGTAVLLYACSRGVHEDNDAASPVNRKERAAHFGTGLLSLLMPCISIGAIGFSMQATRTMLAGAMPTDVVASSLFSVALIVGPLVIFVLFERTRYRVNMDIFYRVFAPVIAPALLFLPAFGLWYSYVVMACLYVVFNIASIMGILACAQVSRHYRIPSISIYAFSFGIIYSARFLPGLAASILDSIGIAPGQVFTPGHVALGGVFALFVAYAASDHFLSRQREAEVYSWESSLPSKERPVLSLTQGQVVEFAKREGLTNREIEVLMRLREGRSVPYIAESLCVADNTVKYHCKNIYKKLGVHSRQELFDLLDGRAFAQGD